MWRDLVSRPTQFGLPAPSAPSQSPLSSLLSVRTPRKFLQGRLTPEMETQILFVLGKVKITNQKRYQKWFAARWLTTAESDSLIVDLYGTNFRFPAYLIPRSVRYIVCVYHPPNHILSSDVVPRWAFIGWLMRCIRVRNFYSHIYFLTLQCSRSLLQPMQSSLSFSTGSSLIRRQNPS